ncbi:MAG TPA: hypothetical protein VJ598_05930 [Albitalea sp.]|nr:hypothetical protein [Albitalea sp.]
MADFEALNAKLDAAMASLSGVSSDIDTLKQEIADLQAQLAAGGLTAEQEARVEARIDELVAAAAALDIRTAPPETPPT